MGVALATAHPDATPRTAGRVPVEPLGRVFHVALGVSLLLVLVLASGIGGGWGALISLLLPSAPILAIVWMRSAIGLLVAWARRRPTAHARRLLVAPLALAAVLLLVWFQVPTRKTPA